MKEWELLHCPGYFLQGISNTWLQSPPVPGVPTHQSWCIYTPQKPPRNKANEGHSTSLSWKYQHLRGYFYNRTNPDKLHSPRVWFIWKELTWESCKYRLPVMNLWVYVGARAWQTSFPKCLSGALDRVSLPSIGSWALFERRYSKNRAWFSVQSHTQDYLCVHPCTLILCQLGRAASLTNPQPKTTNSLE